MPNPVISPAKDKQLVGSWFYVEIPGLTMEAITEAAGLEMEIDAAEFTQATKDGRQITKKMPGAGKFGEITLKRPLGTDKSFYNWMKKITDGNAEFRVDGSIVLYDIANKEAGRWNFLNAWPSKWSASDLDVGTDDPVMEELTIQIEFLKRVS